MASIAGTHRAPGAVGLQPPRGPAATPLRAPAAGASETTLMAGTTALFLGLLTLMFIEYTGLSKAIPILKVSRFSTILAYGLTLMVIVRMGSQALVEYTQSKVLLLFVFFTGFSVLYAVVRSYVMTDFRAQLDYFGLFMTTLYFVDRRKRLNMLSVVCAAITIVLVARNLGKLMQEQRTAVFTAAHFMGDGNDFAWGLVTLLPFSVFLIIGRQTIVNRFLGLGGLAAGLIGVMGTQSRGAALAVVAMALFYWVMLAKRKAATAIALVVVVVVAIPFAPSGYTDRLKTIENYEEDSSAQGRLRAWKAAVSMAIDYPLGVGAGSFNSAYGRFYMPPDPQGWAPNRWMSAHSVYFKVLGEYGFLGVGIVLWMIGSCILLNLRSVKRIRANPAMYSIPDSWPALVAMGIVGYAVGALFLGGITYPHLYFLAGLSVGCRRMLDMTPTGQPEMVGAAPKAVVVPPARAPVAPRAVAHPRPTSSPPAGRGKFFD